MENEPSIEQAAERIVAWAAQHPLGAEETEKRYAHLLAGLPSIPAATPEWTLVRLGRLAVRYCKDRVEDLQQTLDGISLAPAAAFRGGAAAEETAPAERILKAEGTTGLAWLKITENPDHRTVALALWLEPKQPAARIPFRVTVFGPGGSVVAGPVDCAARNVVRFASVAPAIEYTLVFKTDAESWRIRWAILPAQA